MAAQRGSVAAPPVELSAASRAVFLAFIANGVLFATWASRIPDAIRELQMSTGEFSILLLCISIGALVAMPASGRVVGAIGVRTAITAGAAVAGVGILIATAGVTLWQQPLVVGPGLAASGLGIGIWDASMNMAGADVERGLGKSLMPHYHAAFSGGTVASALVGALASAARVPLLAHAVVVVLLLGIALSRGLVPLERLRPAVDPEGAQRPRARSAWLEPRTLLIGVVVLVAAFTEGTANDWIAEAFVSGHEVAPWAGTLAFAIFLTFMTIGRLGGTVLLDRYGRIAVLRVGFVMAVIGTAIVVFAPVGLAYLGVAIWGLGVSLGFPVGMSAAADEPERAPARVAVVTTIGYTAFLAGPPLLGFLGEHYGILRALLVAGAASLIALACLPAVRESREDVVRPATD
ncbi:MFS transporter [Dermacoccaceae bacterium W4C1]